MSKQTLIERLAEHIKANNHPLHHASPGAIESALAELKLALVKETDR